jgi:hypothetical protein
MAPLELGGYFKTLERYMITEVLGPAFSLTIKWAVNGEMIDRR